MNLIGGCSLSCLVLQILFNLIFLLNWSNCSHYLDFFYKKAITPHNKHFLSTSSSNQDRTLDRSRRQKSIHYVNPLSMHKFPPSIDDLKTDYDPQSKFDFNADQNGLYDQQQEQFNGNKKRSNKNSFERTQLERLVNRQLDQKNQSLRKNEKQQCSEQQQQEPQTEQIPKQSQSTSCDCEKTKYIAIEVPKIVRVPTTESNIQSSLVAANDQTSQLQSFNASFTGETETTSTSSIDRESNNQLVGKTRIITIRELPSSLSRTILLNTIVGRTVYENKQNSNEIKNELQLKPSRVNQIQPSLATYVGYEEN